MTARRSHFPRRFRLCVLSLALASAPAAASTPEEQGLQIARKADQANEGFGSERSELTMELVNAHGDVTTRRLVIEAIERPGDGDRSRAIFQWPADVKGTKLLTFTHQQGDDDQWLFLPAVKRVKRISSNNKSGSFMGSEFAYEDLASTELPKYRYKLLGDSAVGGRPCWQLERVPVDRNSGYSRQVMFMDKEYLNPLRIDYYDRKNELLKIRRVLRVPAPRAVLAVRPDRDVQRADQEAVAVDLERPEAGGQSRPGGVRQRVARGLSGRSAGRANDEDEEHDDVDAVVGVPGGAVCAGPAAAAGGGRGIRRSGGVGSGGGA